MLAIALQALPVNFLLSSRCRGFGSLGMRAALAAIYIALPNTMEIDASMEEAQWHVALLACLILLSFAPRALGWRIFDVSVVVIFGLSGPFVVMLLPLALVFWYGRRQAWTLVLSALLAVCAIVQISALLQMSASGRVKMFLAPTATLFLQLLAGHVYLGALLGMWGFAGQNLVSLALVAIGATALVAYCFWKAELEWKLLIVFCFLAFAAALKYPMVPAPQWPVLAKSPGIRYWFLPTLAFAWVLAWGARNTRPRFIRILATLGLITMSYGICRDWSYPPMPDRGFRNYARWFRVAPPGAILTIPILPNGDWTMRITKHAPACSTLPGGAIDQPREAAVVSGRIPVSGWVTQRDLKNLTIYVDRKDPEIIPVTMSSDARPQGWTTLLDVSKEKPGLHEIEVRATSANGCQADIGTVTVNVIR
jgi:hypothetical protein